MDEREDAQQQVLSPTRRNFLLTGSVAVGGGLAGAAGLGSAALAEGNLPPNIPEWMTYPGDDVAHNPYGLPSGFEKDVVRKILGTPKQLSSASSRTPLQDLDGIITPNGLHYERHHGGIPDIDPAQHRLMVFGLVEKPLIFTVDDLRRFPSVSRVHFLECSGNQSFSSAGRETAGDVMGLVSCAEWTGVPLKTVLEECEFNLYLSRADWLIALTRLLDDAGSMKDATTDALLFHCRVMRKHVAVLAFTDDGRFFAKVDDAPLVPIDTTSFDEAADALFLIIKNTPNSPAPPFTPALRDEAVIYDV